MHRSVVRWAYERPSLALSIVIRGFYSRASHASLLGRGTLGCVDDDRDSDTPQTRRESSPLSSDAEATLIRFRRGRARPVT
ncbi:hypothetical protein MTO96_024159 [Rhipicephalus appendiculatus]